MKAYLVFFKHKWVVWAILPVIILLIILFSSFFDGSYQVMVCGVLCGMFCTYTEAFMHGSIYAGLSNREEISVRLFHASPKGEKMIRQFLQADCIRRFLMCMLPAFFGSFHGFLEIREHGEEIAFIIRQISLPFSRYLGDTADAAIAALALGCYLYFLISIQIVLADRFGGLSVGVLVAVICSFIYFASFQIISAYYPIAFYIFIFGSAFVTVRYRNSIIKLYEQEA